MPRAKIIALIALLVTFASTQAIHAESAEDKLQWLEDNKSPEVEAWVKGENERTRKRLESGPEFQERYRESMKILTSNQTIDSGIVIDGFVYAIYRDIGKKEGVWRRTSWKSYLDKKPVWETVFDIDQINVEEKATFSFGYADCLKPKYERCLISFSYAGSDAKITREFDLKTKTFVKNGFNLPLSTSLAVWIDESNVFLLDSMSEGSQTNYGKPRLVREWKRNQKIEEAKIIFEGDKNHLRTFASPYPTEDKDVIVIGTIKVDRDADMKIYQGGKFLDFNLPKKLHIIGFRKDSVYVQAGERSTDYAPGTILVYPFEKQVLGKARVLWKPKAKEFDSYAMLVKDNLYVIFVKDVSNRIIKISLTDENFPIKDLEIPQNGIMTMMRAGDDSEFVKITNQSSLEPLTVYFYNNDNQVLTKFASVEPSFDSSQMERVQKWVKSPDGSMIPYFFIGKKGIKRNGKNPTILFGYGGFGISMIPIYMSLSGKLWLEKGGYFAFANIRGGGEFGKDWHEAGKGKNKQKVFDDFIAIAEDLISTKVTTPAHLGINGGSNGGLLVGAVLTQRPELFNAVVCESPLLDMLRFPKLFSVGAGWIDEYGNPDLPEDARYLRKYSPLHNLKENTKYPEVLFLTSGNDDRVHPGHARKMAERMRDLKIPYLYSEAAGGGHFNGNLEFTAHAKSLSLGFLWDKLGPAATK